MADDAGRLACLFSWCGMALVAAGVFMVVATLLHPSRETATTIVASESSLGTSARRVSIISIVWACPTGQVVTDIPRGAI